MLATTERCVMRLFSLLIAVNQLVIVSAQTTACAKEAEIGVILDHSTSIEFQDPNNWDVSIKGFLTQLIDAFLIGPTMTRMGMVGFSSGAWLYFGFDTHNDSRTLTQAVIDWELHGGETNIAQGFRVARTELFSQARPNVTKIAILIVDGEARDDRETIPEANKIKAEGVEVFSVGITDLVDDALLRDIASPDTSNSSQHYFYVENFDELPSIVPSLLDSLCPRPSTTTTSTTTTSTTTPTTTTTTPTTTPTTPTTTPTTTTTETTTTTTTPMTTPTTTMTATTTPSTTTTTTSTTTTPTVTQGSTSVDNVWPLYGPVAGGTRVTISGQFLSVSTVSAVYFGHHEGVIDKHRFAESKVFVTTPPVNDTERRLAIDIVLNDGSRIDTGRTFQYRRNPAFSDIKPRNHLSAGGTIVTVYGNHLDSVAVPRITITVVVSRINNDTNSTSSISNTDSEGQHLQRGSRLVDFHITIGVAVCFPLSLSDNQVDCRPPTNRPNKRINDTFCQDDTMSLQVMVGNAKYQCSCVHYILQDNTAFIIGLSVGIALLLIIVIIVVVIAIFLYGRRRSKLAKQAEMSVDQDNDQSYSTIAIYVNDEHDYSRCLPDNDDYDYISNLPDGDGYDYITSLPEDDDQYCRTVPGDDNNKYELQTHQQTARRSL